MKLIVIFSLVVFAASANATLNSKPDRVDHIVCDVTKCEQEFSGYANNSCSYINKILIDIYSYNYNGDLINAQQSYSAGKITEVSKSGETSDAGGLSYAFRTSNTNGVAGLYITQSPQFQFQNSLFIPLTEKEDSQPPHYIDLSIDPNSDGYMLALYSNYEKRTVRCTESEN